MKKLPLACAIATLSGTALAQTPPMEEMIVTGSRTPESLDEVPASVSVVDLQTLQQDMKISTELQNILSFRVPGMAPSTNSTSNFGQTLRGRNALVMIDGVPQSTPLRNGALDVRSIDPAALQRVEVLKGATSVYGNGAAGGIINYITRQPGEQPLQVELQQDVRVSAVDADDSVGYRTSMTADGSSGRFDYVFSASLNDYGVQRDAEGDIIGMALYGLSDVKTQNLFGKLGYSLDANRHLGLTYSWYDSEQSSRLVDVVSSINDGTKTYAVPAPAGSEIPGEAQGSDGNTNLALQYRDEQFTDTTRLTVDAYAQSIENVFFYSTFFADPEAGHEGGNSVIVSDKKGLRLNLETELDFNGAVATFIYGADLLNDVTAQPLADGRSWVPDMDMRNRAGYLQSKWVAGDWVLKGGLRHELVDIGIPDYTTLRMCGTGGVCNGNNPVQGGELSYRDTTWNAGLRYNGFATWSPFVSYSQGFDVSDLGLLLRAASVPDIDQVHTRASIIDHYEAGITGNWNNWNYEMAVYLSQSELGTATVESPPGSGLYVPVRAPQDIHGFEAAVGYAFSRSLEAGATYSYVEGKNPDDDSYLDARKIAPPKFTAWLDWQAAEGLSVNTQYLRVLERDRFEPVNGRYVGAQAPVSSYDVVNLSAIYQLRNWNLSAGIENLFNERYFPARAQAFTYDGYNTMGAGRSVALGINYRF